MIQRETDPRFRIGPSRLAGAGLGVFATTPLAAGDQLHVLGVLVPADSVADECTRYADAYKFRVGDHVLVPIGFGGIVNHSAAAPNMEKVRVGQEVYLRALRSIASGEELLYVYSDYARERFQLRD
jgi:hypothetical protein